MLTPLHSVTHREEHKSTSYCYYGNMENSLLTAHAPTIEESQWKGEWAGVWRFTKRFKQRINLRNTSAITAVTKSSIKPRRGTAVNLHLRSYWERKRTQRRNKKDKGNTMMHTLKLLCLVKRHISGRSDNDQWRNQACSLNCFWITLVWSRQSDSQSVSQ